MPNYLSLLCQRSCQSTVKVCRRHISDYLTPGYTQHISFLMLPVRESKTAVIPQDDASYLRTASTKMPLLMIAKT